MQKYACYTEVTKKETKTGINKKREDMRMTMAEKQISYKSIFGAYVMRAQYELASWNQEQKSGEDEKQQMIRETVEDYIEQA